MDLSFFSYNAMDITVCLKNLKPFNKWKYVLCKDEKFRWYIHEWHENGKRHKQGQVFEGFLWAHINLESFEDNQFIMLSNTQLKVWGWNRKMKMEKKNTPKDSLFECFSL